MRRRDRESVGKESACQTVDWSGVDWIGGWGRGPYLLDLPQHQAHTLIQLLGEGARRGRGGGGEGVRERGGGVLVRGAR